MASSERRSVEFADQPWAEALRSWLLENLPKDWRGVGGGSMTDEDVEVRCEWGRRLHAGGFGCPLWPVEAGGMGLDLKQYVRYESIMAEFRAPSPMNSNAIGIVGPVLLRYGTPEQQRRFLPPILDHTEIWCQGFSEAGAGSDLASLRTTARRDGNQFIVNGQKLWTSNSMSADWGYFLVRTAKEVDRHDGISWLMIRMDSPGVEIRPIRNIVGEFNFAEVFLTDVYVPEDQLIGPEGAGWQITRYALENERVLGMTYRSLHMEREFWEWIKRFRVKHEFALPHRLLNTYGYVLAVQALVYRNVENLINGRDVGAGPSVAKLVWSETHQDMIEQFMSQAGREAVLEGGEFSALGALALGGRAQTIYAGVSEVQRDLIARFCELDDTTATGARARQGLPRLRNGGIGEQVREWVVRQVSTRQAAALATDARTSERTSVASWNGLCEQGWLSSLTEFAYSDNRPAAERAGDITEVSRALGAEVYGGPVALVAGYVLPLIELLDAVRLRKLGLDGRSVTAAAPALGRPPKLLDVTKGKLGGSLTGIPRVPTANQVLAFIDVGGMPTVALIPLAHPCLRVDERNGLQLGQRLGAVRFDSLPIEDIEVVAQGESVLEKAIVAANWYHLALSGYALGATEGALRDTVRHVRSRTQFGRPLAALQVVRHRVADMRTAVDLGLANVESATAALLEGRVRLDQIAATRIITTLGLRTVSAGAIQLHGAMGYSWETGIHRYYRAGWYQELGEGSLHELLDDFRDWAEPSMP